MSKCQILGVIQVRFSSQRLPGKALRDVGKAPLLRWVIERSKLSKRVDQWIVATSDDVSCDPIIDICRDLEIEVFRGDESDVLSRFVSCVNLFQPQYVVRVCADNPFVWGPLIDDLVDQLDTSDVYLANQRPHERCCIADGFGAELIAAQLLIDNHLSFPSITTREHVTTEISKRHSPRNVRVPSELRHPYLRFDVDTVGDLQRIHEFVLAHDISFSSSPSEIIDKVLGDEFQKLLEELFPLQRSLAGAMNRRTLDILERVTPLCRKQVRTGTNVFDWVIPPEWSVTEGYIKNVSGERLVDFAENSLHVISYSSGINETIGLAELKSHLYVHPTLEAIPYRTTYYRRDWGFAITPSQLKRIEEDGGPFSVVIQADFQNGFLDFAEQLVAGDSPREILISTYFCHPNLANDSLSGVVLTVFLARYLKSQQRLRNSYRIVFVPETVGALAFLDSLGDSFNRIFCGLQVATVGGPGSYQIKQSWNPHHPINSIASRILEASGKRFQIRPFDIHGSDERQYSSPGFRLNVITIARDIYYSYPEYHSSLDNLDLVTGQQIYETFGLYLDLIDALESRRVFVRTEPRGEPMLNRHNLYNAVGGSLIPDSSLTELDLALWVLFLCDGDLSSDEIALRLSVSHQEVLAMCGKLETLKLLRED